MFHLFTHAFFKALLFLSAGSVMHAMGNVIDMRRFGGLRRLMPITFVTFLVGCLALSGIVPFAGFWSKDAIVASVHHKSHDLEHELEHRHVAAAGASGDSIRPVALAAAKEDSASSSLSSTWSDQQLARGATIFKILYYVALFTAFLTAFYTFRALYMTFFGAEVIPHEAGHHAHESPWVMWVPLVILAIFAAGVGLVLDNSYLNGTHPFADLLALTPSLTGPVASTERLGEFHIEVAAVSLVVALAGIALASVLYLGNPRWVAQLQAAMDFRSLTEFGDVEAISRLRTQPWVRGIDQAASRVGLGWLVRFLGNVLLLVVLTLSAPLLLGRFVSPYRLSFGKFFFDEIYNALVVTPLRWAARFFDLVDDWVVDGLVNAVGRVPPMIGNLMRSMQTGLVQFYALAMVLGGLVLLLVINQQLDGQLLETIRGLFGMITMVMRVG
jgi:NADH-quinone oxidoreductase subunit L